MPRTRDIGWQHGTMIGGCRHHLQCNYCHRIMTGGGITRFKEHLACKKGETKGCEAVPKEVREIFQKHLAAEKVRKKKRKKDEVDLFSLSSADKDTRSDESEREIAATGLESLRTSNEGGTTYIPEINGKRLLPLETQEFLVASSAIQVKDDESFAPPRATDPGWAHGMMVNGGRHKVKCKYCHKVIVGGGITRLKQHLAGERGNVAPCEEVPEDVKLQFQKHLGFKDFEKRKRHQGLETGNNASMSYADNCKGNDDTKRKGKENDKGTSIRPNKHKKNSYQIAVPAAQPKNKSFTSKEIIDQADMAVANFMYRAGIPLSASNSCYFQKMADAIAAAGPGYKMPSYHALRGKLLNRNIQEAVEQCCELKKSWEMSGCSVLVERWTDKIGRTIINFFVYSCKGTIFLKSVDTTDNTRSSEALLSLFDSVVQEVGPDNIVNFVTDTEPSYKAAGKALMAKYGTFFWNACTAHCIDFMLEKIGELDEVKQVLGKAKQIIQFIYNNRCVFNMMKKKTGTKDIIQLGNTRHESIFLTLKSIRFFREPLHQMLKGASGVKSSFSIQGAGIEVAEIMEDTHFWSMCDRTVNATEPLLTLLSLLDCEDRPSIGYIYDAMEKAKRSVILAFNNKESDYLPYLEVIDRIWQEELYTPLYAAGFYLNPSLFYNSRFSTNKVIQKGLLDCIEILEPNLDAQVKITSQISFYEDAVGDFGRPVALCGRESLAPATWWSLYASDYPELQKLAVRILSQSGGTMKCQSNWIMFERIHAKKRNRLEHQRLKDLIFVHYNLELKERQESSKTRSTMDACNPVCLETMDPMLTDWVEESIEGEDWSGMDSAILGKRSVLSSKLFSNGSVYDSSSDNSKGIDEHEAV